MPDNGMNRLYRRLRAAFRTVAATHRAGRLGRASRAAGRAVSFIYSASVLTFRVYCGVYPVQGLGWRPSQVGLLFLLAAPLAAVANYLSGHVSDRVGRKRPIIASFLGSTVNVTALSVLGEHTLIAFALIMVQGVIGAPAYSLD